MCVVNKTDFRLLGLSSAGDCCSPYILDLYKNRVFRSQIRLIQLLFHIADLTTDLNQFWSKSKCFKVRNKQTAKGFFSSRSLKPDEADIQRSESDEEGMVEEPPLLLPKIWADIFRESILNPCQHLLHKGSVS